MQTQNDNGLVEAARDLKLRKVSDLVLTGADPNSTDAQTGQTALHIAAESGHKDLCLVLILTGGDISRKDKSGKTALDLCSNLGLRDYLKNHFMNIPAERVLDYDDHRIWSTPTDNASFMVFDRIRFKWTREPSQSSDRQLLKDTHDKTTSYSCVNTSPSISNNLVAYSWNAADCKFWHDAEGFEILNRRIGKIILAICRCFREGGYGAWISGLFLSQQLRDIYEIAPGHNEPLPPTQKLRPTVFVTCSKTEFLSLAKSKSWDVSECQMGYILEGAFLRLLPPCPTDDHFHPDAVRTVSTSIFYDPYQRVLFDPYATGFMDTLLHVARIPSVNRVTGKYSTPSKADYAHDLFWNPISVVHYFLVLSVGFRPAVQFQHETASQSLLLLLWTNTCVVIECLSYLLPETFQESPDAYQVLSSWAGLLSSSVSVPLFQRLCDKSRLSRSNGFSPQKSKMQSTDKPNSKEFSLPLCITHDARAFFGRQRSQYYRTIQKHQKPERNISNDETGKPSSEHASSDLSDACLPKMVYSDFDEAKGNVHFAHDTRFENGLMKITPRNMLLPSELVSNSVDRDEIDEIARQIEILSRIKTQQSPRSQIQETSIYRQTALDADSDSSSCSYVEED